MSDFNARFVALLLMSAVLLGACGENLSCVEVTDWKSQVEFVGERGNGRYVRTQVPDGSHVECFDANGLRVEVTEGE